MDSTYLYVTVPKRLRSNDQIEICFKEGGGNFFLPSLFPLLSFLSPLKAKLSSGGWLADLL